MNCRQEPTQAPGLSLWGNSYSSVQPTGWALRAAFPDRWLRIHSLTDCKRYAETEQDWSTLNERHRHATSLLLREDEDGYLVVPWSCAENEVFHELGLRPSLELPAFQPDPNAPATGPYHISGYRWRFDAFSPILEAVSDWKTMALFVTADASRIYAPYDGGADLFTSNSGHLSVLEADLKAYLSPLKSGL